MKLNNKEQKIYNEIYEIVETNYGDKPALTNRLFEYVNRKLNSSVINIDTSVDPSKVFESLATLNVGSVSRVRGASNE